MKIFQLNFSDIVGGAARASYRIHHAVKTEGVDSTLHVAKRSSNDNTVATPDSFIFKHGLKVRQQLAALVRKTSRVGYIKQTSLSILASGWPGRINQSDAELVHLHWTCKEMMSVEDVARIQKPVVWTLHDMWAFCGAEHYVSEDRWRSGYTTKNRPDFERGLDLNHWVWKRKLKSWKKPLQIVTPSAWLADCARQSKLMKDWPITIIHNAINTDVWKPMDRLEARKRMGLPSAAKLIIFGKMGNNNRDAHRKGFDLLFEALGHTSRLVDDLQLIVFGPSRPAKTPDIGIPVHYLGQLDDDQSIRMLYSAADAVIIPSRMDNFPNVGIEALSCGTPVVVFDVCGAAEIVKHKKTGWLAKAFDTEDMAKGIHWVTSDKDRNKLLRQVARRDAEERFSYPVVAAQYKKLYQEVLARQ